MADDCVEQKPFEVLVTSPIHLHQTVWVIRKYKTKVEIGMCLACGGKGEVLGQDRRVYPCPRKIESRIDRIGQSVPGKDCDDGTSTQMSMEWDVYEGKVDAVDVKIENWGEDERSLRQTLSYRVQIDLRLFPSGDWGYFKLEEIGPDLADQIYTTKEEAQEVCDHLKDRDNEDG